MIDDLRRILADRRILLVEDESLIAMDIQDIIENWGCIVIGPAPTSAVALDLMAEHALDGAILDVNLRGETSEPIANALREQNRPFVVMSAYERSHLNGALREAPLLSKPVDEKKLGQELCALFEGTAAR